MAAVPVASHLLFHAVQLSLTAIMTHLGTEIGFNRAKEGASKRAALPFISARCL